MYLCWYIQHMIFHFLVSRLIYNLFKQCYYFELRILHHQNPFLIYQWDQQLLHIQLLHIPLLISVMVHYVLHAIYVLAFCYTVL